MKKSLPLNVLKSLQRNKALPVLALACVMAVSSILLIFTSEAQATPSMPRGGFTALTWGSNSHGQVGHGTVGAAGNLHVPTRLNYVYIGDERVRARSAWRSIYGGGEYTIALTVDGRIFTWGANFNGQLGRGHRTPHPAPDEYGWPRQMGTADNWRFIAARGSGGAAINTLGHLYAWGHATHVWNPAGQVGTVHGNAIGANWTGSTFPPPVNPLHEPVRYQPYPVRLNNAAGDTWEMVVIGTANKIGITTDGYMYTIGNNNSGQLGVGVTSATPVESDNLANLVSGAPNLPAGVMMPLAAPFNTYTWQHVSLSDNHVAAITTDGELYVWGANHHGQLGLGYTSGGMNLAAGNYSTPMQPIGADNYTWIDASARSGVTAAITSCNRLYIWGQNGAGQLGQGFHGGTHAIPGGVNDIIIPTMQHVPGSWARVQTGGHTLALTTDNVLYSWGQNVAGQLGLVDAPPNPNPPTAGYNPANFSPREIMTAEMWGNFGHGVNHSIALARLPDPVYLTKTLELNEGTAIPSPDLSFTFNFVRVQVPLNDANPPRLSRPIAEVPNITNQTVTVNSATAVTAGGVTSITGELDLWILIQDVLDAANVSGGVFVWEVTEVANSSNVNASPAPNTMTYDESRFQIRAHVNRYGDLRIVELIEMEQVSGNWQIRLPKLEDGIEFVNTYTRRVGNNERAALYINKYVDERDMADLSTRFNFTITLTNPVIIPPAIGTVTATVLNATTELPVSPARTYPIGAGTSNFTLAHNEKLRIPELPAGTRFQITENARPRFIPEATILGSTPVPPATGTYPQQDVGDPLPTGTYIIHQTNLNRANFTNTYVWDVPTGLFITSTPWIALGAVALLLALLVITRNRKRIEEIPLVL